MKSIKATLKKGLNNLMKFFNLLFSDNYELLNKYCKGKWWIENEE